MRTRGDVLHAPMSNKQRSLKGGASMDALRNRLFPHQWSLPESEGVIARLGKGRVEGLNFSPDRKRLAVSSGVGLWLINMDDLTPSALWTGKAAYAVAGRVFAVWGTTCDGRRRRRSHLGGGNRRLSGIVGNNAQTLGLSSRLLAGRQMDRGGRSSSLER